MVSYLGSRTSVHDRLQCNGYVDVGQAFDGIRYASASISDHVPQRVFSREAGILERFAFTLATSDLQPTGEQRGHH